LLFVLVAVLRAISNGGQPIALEAAVPASPTKKQSWLIAAVAACLQEKIQSN
jgi:hypothetical protein